MVGKNLKHVVRIYDVFQFSNEDVFGLIQEKMDPLPESIKSDLEDAFDKIVMLKIKKTPFHHGSKAFKVIAQEELSPEDFKLVDNTFNKYQLYDIMDELLGANVKFHDYNPGNIMRRGSDIVVIDLGISEAPAGAVDVLEADEKKAKPKGIPHLEDLNPQDFMKWLEKYKDIKFNGKLEVSEKVDGSAKMDFGVDQQGLWAKSKNGGKMYRSSAWGEKPMFRALRKAHAALETKADAITKAWPKGIESVSSEVLYTKIPNSIEYGKNIIMIHGVEAAGGESIQPNDSKIAAETIIKPTGGKLSALGDDWQFEYKPVISGEDVMIDVKKEFDDIKSVYDDLVKSLPDKLKKDGKPIYKGHLENFKNIQAAVKKKLVGQLRGMKSVYGPEGGDVEGVVFRDLEDDFLVKLVDKEYFSKLNKFLWFYREMLSKGAKIGDEWKPGVIQSLRNMIADDVMGAPVAKTPSFSGTLIKYSQGLKWPNDADTKQKKADHLLHIYIKDNGFMAGDFASRFENAVDKAEEQFNILKSEWEDKKKKPQHYTVKDDEGKPIKKVKMDNLIIGRTDDAMKDMNEFFSGMHQAMNKISSFDDDTKRVALVKLMMGDNRVEKLEQSIGSTNEAGDLFGKKDSLPQDQGAADNSQSASQLDPANAKDAQQLLTKYSKLLAGKKKINILSAKVLGTGTQGTAFDIGGDKVLKLTKDKKEAIASNKLLGSAMESVAKIFDVFKLKEEEVYGIVQEKLDPLSASEKKEYNEMLVFTAIPLWLKHANTWDEAVDETFKFVVKKRGDGDVKSDTSKEAISKADKIIDSLEQKFNMKKMWEELKAKGISFYDFQGDNLMKRGGEYVLIDIGLSNVTGGQEPGVLERIIRETVSTLFNEAKTKKSLNPADTIGVTIGRFQPFHLGHAEIIRKLASQFTKVIILVAGNKQDKKNPFSYETRLDMMKKSLPDVANKIETYRAEWDGRSSGFLPGVISNIISNSKSSIKQDSAVNILVGPDRYDTFKTQIDGAEKYKDKIPEFNPSLYNVEKLPGVTGDIDDSGRISATQIRDALVKNDKVAVSKMLDPHIVSNAQEFDHLYVSLRDELSKVTDINEATSLDKAGGDDAFDATLKANQENLQKLKSIDVSKLRKLGAGTKGIAYDVGGGKVLKVTSDHTEAQASHSITGDTLNNVVKIFDVFKFGKVKSNDTLYGIVQEKLAPLSSTEQKEIVELFNFIDASSKLLTSIATETWDQFVNKLYSEIEDDVTKELGVDPKSPAGENKIRKVAANKHAAIVGKLKKYNIHGMISDLRKSNIQFADYHEGNVMKRGSEYVINDLGMSKSQGGDPPVFENLLRSMTESVIKEFGSGGTIGGGLGHHAAQGSAQSSAWSSASKFRKPYVDDELPFEDDYMNEAEDSPAIKTSLPLGEWNKWTEKSSDVPFGIDKADTGPGEKKLYFEFHGKDSDPEKWKSTDNTYDIQGPSGEKIEVKKYGNFRKTIEFGKALDLKRRIEKIALELDKGLSSVDSSKLIELDPNFKELLDKAKIIANEIHKSIGVGILTGKEVSKHSKTDVGLLQIIRAIYYQHEKYKEDSGNKKIDILVNDEIINITKRQHLKILDILNMKSDGGENILDVVYSKFHDPVFDNPEELKTVWESGKDLWYELFNSADYIALVDETKGWQLVDKELLGQQIRWTGFSKGDLKIAKAFKKKV